jgi:hypothetical protein
MKRRILVRSLSVNDRARRGRGGPARAAGSGPARERRAAVGAWGGAAPAAVMVIGRTWEGRMADREKGDKRFARAMREAAYGGHSDMYRWLRKRYAQIAGSLSVDKPAWRSVAAELATEGVVGARGQRPSAKSVREMWRRVCRDVERERAAREAEPGTPRRWKPPRSQSDWRPEPVRALGPPATSRGDPVPAAAGLPKAADQGGRSEDPYAGLSNAEAAKLSFLRFRRQLASRSGRDPDKVK